VAIAYKHVQENPVPPRRIDPSLPETLEAITLKCLAKNPANRYPSAQDLRADLRRYLDGSRIMAEPVLAPPIDPGATGMMAPTGYGDQTALVAGPVGYQGDGYGDYDEYDDYEDEEEPKRSKWFLAALILLLLVLAGLIFLFVNNMSDSEPPVETETVPNVVGQDITAATTMIEDAGFEVNQQFEPSDAPESQVTAQDPAAAEKAELGSTVTLTVSQGPDAVTVPDVVGKPELEANQELVAAGFLVTPVPVEDSDVEEGLVISQDPAGNGQAPPGATITINVSAGQSTVPVPNVDGAPEADARAALQGVGLTNITTQPQASADIPAGNVISTNPGAGTEVTPDQTITLIISSGPDQVSVPTVQGLSEENARTQIESAGLVMATSDQQVSNPGQDGQVLSQSPGPNSQANPGDTVTVIIGRFREPEIPPEPDE
jgi:eukaryotic-like serine/threonine-protein kinase